MQLLLHTHITDLFLPLLLVSKGLLPSMQNTYVVLCGNVRSGLALIKGLNLGVPVKLTYTTYGTAE